MGSPRAVFGERAAEKGKLGGDGTILGLGLESVCSHLRGEFAILDCITRLGMFLGYSLFHYLKGLW